MHNLLKNVQTVLAKTAVAAGTTAVTGNVIDTFGYDGVAFFFLYGTLTATQVTNAKIQMGSASNGSDAADVAGSHTTALLDTQSNTIQIIDVYRPTYRYVTPVINRGTANAVVNGIVAVLYHAELAPPPALDASVASAIVFLTYPALGTA